MPFPYNIKFKNINRTFLLLFKYTDVYNLMWADLLFSPKLSKIINSQKFACILQMWLAFFFHVWIFLKCINMSSVML